MKKKTKLTDLSGSERKQYLEMDMVERMIRAEQAVSASFKKPITYNQTDCYKRLTPSEKRKFEKYLKKKTTRRIVAAILIIVPLVLLLVFHSKLTGSVVRETVPLSESNTNLLSIFLSVFSVGILVFYFISWISTISKNRIIKRNVSVIDRVLRADIQE